jgi:hypothetical protein
VNKDKRTRYRELARETAQSSIVVDALGRLIEQVVQEAVLAERAKHTDPQRVPPMHEVYNFARSNPQTFAEIAAEFVKKEDRT